MKYLFLSILLNCSGAFANEARFSMDASWSCRMGEGSNKAGYTCTKNMNGKRSVVKADFKPAKPDSLETTFKVLNTPMKDISIKSTKKIMVSGQEWIESIQQASALPVPTMILFTVKKNTAFRFIVISDESNFETIKNNVRDAVARSN